MPNESGAERDFVGGKVSSSAISAFHLIPAEALRRYARRCQVGVERKGDKAWNAMTTHNQDILTSKEFALERINHLIGHALTLRDKIARGEPLLAGDDDAGAIIWNGGYLCCATAAMAAAVPPLNCSGCGGTGTIADHDQYFRNCPACHGSGKSRAK